MNLDISKTNEIAYKKDGVGDTRLLFLHGLCGSKEIWREQFSDLVQDYELIAVDLLGHGESSAVSANEIIFKNATTLLDFLKELPPKKTVLLGHSLGGMILHEMIALQADATAFVFVDSPCICTEAVLAEYVGIENILKSADNPGAFMQTWFSGFIHADASTEIKELVVDSALKFDPNWIAEVMGAITYPRKCSTNKVVHVMEGIQFFPKDSSISWKEYYPQASVWKYQGNGHFFFLEDPKTFNQEVRRFTDSILGLR